MANPDHPDLMAHRATRDHQAHPETKDRPPMLTLQKEAPAIRVRTVPSVLPVFPVFLERTVSLVSVDLSTSSVNL